MLRTRRQTPPSVDDATRGSLFEVIEGSPARQARTGPHLCSKPRLTHLGAESTSILLFWDSTDFSAAEKTPANNIAKWDGAQWSPLGYGMDDIVHALTVYNDELIAGGSIIARWDDATWSAVGARSGMNSGVTRRTS